MVPEEKYLKVNKKLLYLLMTQAKQCDFVAHPTTFTSLFIF